MNESPAKGLAVLHNKIIIGTSVLFVSCIVVLTLLHYSTYQSRALGTVQDIASKRSASPANIVAATSSLVPRVPHWAEEAVPEPALLSQFLSDSTLYIAILFALAFLLMASCVLIRLHFVKPAVALANHIHQEATQGPAYIPKVPQAWIRWFKMASDTLPLKTVAANLPGAVFQLVQHGSGRVTVAFASAGVKNLLGVVPDEIIGLGNYELRIVPQDDRPKFLAAIERSRRSLAPFEYDCCFSTLAGRKRWVRFLSHPRLAENGGTVWDGLILDVTNSKRATKTLQERVDHLEKMVKEYAEQMQRFQELQARQTKPSTIARDGGNVVREPHNAVGQSRTRTNVPAA